MNTAKKIIYMDGGLASQMSAYAFYKYLETRGLNSEIDFVWYRRMGMDRYKLKEVFDIDVTVYEGSFKYDVYISKNTAARILRRTKLLTLLITAGLIPKLYYTVKPVWGGNIFNVDDLPDETFDLSKELYFWGYWPFGEYLDEIRETLLSEFSFPKLTESENIVLAEDIASNNSVSIHVRRGDYLNYKDVYADVSINYYKDAAEYIDKVVKNPKFYVFSDDIQWCQSEFEKLGLTYRNTIYITWNHADKSYRDMQLMSLCKNNIITNSGFSTWAAFLNKNPDKIVIEPKEYYTKEWIEENEKAGCRFYKNRWIEIDN